MGLTGLRRAWPGWRVKGHFSKEDLESEQGKRGEKHVSRSELCGREYGGHEAGVRHRSIVPRPVVRTGSLGANRSLEALVHSDPMCLAGGSWKPMEGCSGDQDWLHWLLSEQRSGSLVDSTLAGEAVSELGVSRRQRLLGPACGVPACCACPSIPSGGCSHLFMKKAVQKGRVTCVGSWQGRGRLATVSLHVQERKQNKSHMAAFLWC